MIGITVTDLIENLSQNSEYYMYGVLIICIGFLSFVGYRYWELKKKYGDKTHEE